jgi:N utilization substance protein B
LRLGAYEMLHCPEVPAKVAINEALELAKRYSTAQSSRFVNGILDRVLQWQTQESETGAQPEAGTPGEPPPSGEIASPAPEAAPDEAQGE